MTRCVFVYITDMFRLSTGPWPPARQRDPILLTDAHKYGWMESLYFVP